MARSEKDVKTLYPEQTRYFLARKIALCWMKILKTMNEANIEALKTDLSQHIFVGDFIGNQDIMNLIKYARETICFHSVMKKFRTANTARETLFCEPNSFEILNRHAIDVVPNQNCGVFNSYQELCASLSEVHKKVSNSNLSASEEGEVLTFI